MLTLINDPEGLTLFIYNFTGLEQDIPSADFKLLNQAQVRSTLQKGFVMKKINLLNLYIKKCLTHLIMGVIYFGLFI